MNKHIEDIPEASQSGYITILSKNIKIVLDLLDEKIRRILGPLSKKSDTYFFLAGGGAVLLDSNVGGVKRHSKDLDFLWVPDQFYLEEIVNNIKHNKDGISPKREIFGDALVIQDFEDFIERLREEYE